MASYINGTMACELYSYALTKQFESRVLNDMFIQKKYVNYAGEIYLNAVNSHHDSVSVPTERLEYVLNELDENLMVSISTTNIICLICAYKSSPNFKFKKITNQICCILDDIAGILPKESNMTRITIKQWKHFHDVEKNYYDIMSYYLD